MQHLERREFGLVDIKAAGDPSGSFSGYGAVFGNVDSYGDVIQRGAFAETLADWKGRGKLPKMLLQHGGMGITAEDMLPIGQWTDMTEDAKGLKVEGRLLEMSTDLSQRVYAGLKSGELDSLSIGYQTLDAMDKVEDGVEIRLLTKLKLWEVSIVTFPANDRALISSVKQLAPEQLRELEDALGERGFSRSDRLKAVSVFKGWLQREAGETPNSTLREEAMPGADEILEALSKSTDALWTEVFRA